MELAGPIHRHIDRRILGQQIEGALHLRRPRIYPAEVPVVEDPHGRVVFIGAGGSGLFMAQQRRLHLRGQRLAQAVGLLDPEHH